MTIITSTSDLARAIPGRRHNELRSTFVKVFSELVAKGVLRIDRNGPDALANWHSIIPPGEVLAQETAYRDGKGRPGVHIELTYLACLILLARSQSPTDSEALAEAVSQAKEAAILPHESSRPGSRR